MDEKAAVCLENIDPESALKTVAAIFQRIEGLSTFPNRGRIGRKHGTRELLLAPYIVVHKVQDSIVEILHIQHGAQER